jgi:hypothetical protein
LSATDATWDAADGAEMVSGFDANCLFRCFAREAVQAFPCSCKRRLAPERIRVSDRKTEIVASLTGVRQTGFRNAVWTGLTPDNDPLILRDVGTEELFSLNAVVH